ncbi:uncharacterized protein LOC110033208 [Phalaenopsis equestris]|uniref:uncharacterized protein LOC110033208 n=1 Tax=Phalaenopsis equestris TaxID=78828 RepID=UPI0009E59BB6|nr:uncharacterized protein LOC110033208 [Phalaenopsis equestris]
MASLLRFGGQRLISRSSPPISLLRCYSLTAKRDDSGEEELEFFDQRKLPADYNPSNFDPTEHRTPPADRVWRLVDEISSLTLTEVAELSSILMRKAALSEPPIIGVIKPGAALPGAAGAGLGTAADAKEEEKPEKTVFELKLESFEAASKIKVIKEVRAFTDLGLKEAKELVEKSPSVIKSGVSKEEAEQIVEKMKAAGAKVIMA